MTVNTPKRMGLPWGGGQFYLQNVQVWSPSWGIASAASAQQGQRSIDRVPSVDALVGRRGRLVSPAPKSRACHTSASKIYPDSPQVELRTSFKTFWSTWELTGLLICMGSEVFTHLDWMLLKEGYQSFLQWPHNRCDV